MFKPIFYLSYLAVALVLVAALLVNPSSVDLEKVNYKVYECLNFNQNIQALKEHVAQHKDVVDYFVILKVLQNNIEDSENNLEVCKATLAAYSDKMIYVLVSKDTDLNSAYSKALTGCSNSDIILFSDSCFNIEHSKLKEGIAWLKCHPDHSLFLDGVNKKQNGSLKPIEIATYAHVKACKENKKEPYKLKDSRGWRKFFSPF